ncbi:hypothetical protein Tco_1545263, partial [Tanacetum coccineum]
NLQADCDLKATNILLQGLPPDVYTIVNHQKVAKDIWDRVKLLMQGTSLSKQEPRDLHTSNYDQLYAYLEQHEAHANEAHLMRERFPDPLALVANYHQPPSHFNNYHSQYTTPYHTQPSVPQNAYLPLTIPQQPQAKFPQLDSGLAVPTFFLSDDPIACMNKAMAFLSAVFSPCQNVISSGSQKNASGSQGNTSGQAKAEGKELDEERLAFLADPGVADGQVAQTITHNAAF